MIDPERTQAVRLWSITRHLRAAAMPPGALALERGLATLRARIEPRARRLRLLPYARAAGLAVSFVVLCAAALPFLRAGLRGAERPIVVTRIAGGRMLEGGYVSEVGQHGVELYFDEGSMFALAPGARGRLRALTADGARFEIDHGAAEFRIAPSLERRWLVEAGPFLVAVQGTDFTVDWDPIAERLELKLRRGQVTVSGPVVGDELGLRAGQHLAVSLPRAETTITEEIVPETPTPRTTPSLQEESPKRQQEPTGR